MADKMRMGMVGGGSGAFIGAVHRLAAEMTGDIELVAGAFSSDAAASKQFGIELGLAENRSYSNFDEMIDAEAALPEDQRMQCVSIVTPNNSHADIACKALENGNGGKPPILLRIFPKIGHAWLPAVGFGQL